MKRPASGFAQAEPERQFNATSSSSTARMIHPA
jgi:hypothetical protein